jgi:hypothetical protein
MRTASILLSLVVVLGFVRQVGAYSSAWFESFDTDYTIAIGTERFGIRDTIDIRTNSTYRTEVFLGPLGVHAVPFTATQGSVGFCFIVAVLVIMSVGLMIRWKRRQTH